MRRPISSGQSSPGGSSSSASTVVPNSETFLGEIQNSVVGGSGHTIHIHINPNPEQKSRNDKGKQSSTFFSKIFLKRPATSHGTQTRPAKEPAELQRSPSTLNPTSRAPNPIVIPQSIPEHQHTSSAVSAPINRQTHSIPNQRSPTSSPSTLSAANASEPSSSRIDSPTSPSSPRTAFDREAIAALEEAITDPTPFVLTAHDGSVVAGNLVGLVQQLLEDTHGADIHQNSKYREAFLTCCPAFTTAGKVFELIVERYNSAKPETRAATLFNVIMVMKHWVAMRHVMLDNTVLSCMKQFALSVSIPGDMAESVRILARDIDLRIEERASGLQSPKIDRTPPKRRKDVDPHNLAIALTVLEGKRHSNISPTDYLRHLLQSSQPSKTGDALDTNHRIFVWIKSYILESPDHVERTHGVIFFIRTAQECRKLRNFSSLATIVTALQSKSLSRLSLTWRKVGKKEQQSLNALSSVIQGCPDHLDYRNALDISRDRCVPWTVRHLQHLKSGFHVEDVVYKINGRPLIHFSHCLKIVESIKMLMGYNVPTFLKPQWEGTLAYLESQLDSTSTSPATEARLEKRSKEYANQEKKLEAQRTVELDSLGIRRR